jgi:hypothetical protein
MPAWEHRSIFFRYDAATDHWTVTIDGTRHTSVTAALDRLGADGWELVSSQVEDIRVDGDHRYAEGFRCLLKRPRA